MFVLFAVCLKWSPNKKNEMQFVHLATCVPLYLVCDSNFLQVSTTFEMHKRKGEKASKEKFKCR